MTISNENIIADDNQPVSQRKADDVVTLTSSDWQQLERLVAPPKCSAVLRRAVAPPSVRSKKMWSTGCAATMLVLAGSLYVAQDMASHTLIVDGQPHNSVFFPLQEAFQRLAVHAETSMITGIIDTDTLTSSLYWTIDLKNISMVDQEAQAELRLPEGAVVSRATLWINNVPQEAAFNTTDKVTSAYSWVTKLHRDPLLITYKDERTVVIKAAPVPANGDIMKLRIGITVPLSVRDDGQASLNLPQLAHANFALPQSNKVHLESKQIIESSDKSLKRTQTVSGRNILQADLTTDALANLIVSGRPADPSGNFAVRATHSLPGNFIFSQPYDDGDFSYRVLTRRAETPACRIVKSETAAHRVSTIWAGREVRRLLAENKREEALEVAAVYRIVSPVSGAVVLERDTDYGAWQLQRNPYLISVPGDAPDFNQRYTQAVAGYSPNVSTGPVLQGATNGSIMPQGAEVFVQGVNTAGTVREFNSPFEDSLLKMFFLLTLSGFIAAIYFGCRDLQKTFIGWIAQRRGRSV